MESPFNTFAEKLLETLIVMQQHVCSIPCAYGHSIVAEGYVALRLLQDESGI